MKARENPFASQHIENIPYQFHQGDWDYWLHHLEALQYRAAIVGSKGNGKTTLLETLADKLRTRGFKIHTIFLNDNCKRPTPVLLKNIYAQLDPKNIVLLDGAEQMSTIAWQLFKWRCRHAGGLIVTTHGAGWLPTWIECSTNPKLLQWIVQQLLQGKDDFHWPRTDSFADSIQHLFHNHKGNIRNALRELYDWQSSVRTR